MLPQLRARGRVSRGYMGVGLRDVDRRPRAVAKLTVDHGALVQDITAGSPADRAGAAALRRHHRRSTIAPIANDDQLIREIAGARAGHRRRGCASSATATTRR